MNVKERLKKFIASKGLGQKAFEIECGLSNGYVNNIRRSVTIDKARRILERYPELNINWLMTGEGQMLKPQSANSVSVGSVSGNGNSFVAGNNNRVGWSDQNREDVETIEEDAIVISEPVIVPPAIMQRPDTDAKKWVKSREAQTNADRLQISSILKATDMVWRVEDEAMRPTLFMGEYVLIKEMDDHAQVVDGRVYAIDTKYHGNLIRRVYDEGDSYRLDPINSDGYSSVVVNKENGFNRRYRILCHLSTEISILPDVDEERKRQDRLIEEVGKAGSRVDRLIDMLEKKC